MYVCYLSSDDEAGDSFFDSVSFFAEAVFFRPPSFLVSVFRTATLVLRFSLSAAFLAVFPLREEAADVCLAIFSSNFSTRRAVSTSFCLPV